MSLSKVNAEIRDLELTYDQLKTMSEIMLLEMRNGLCKTKQYESCLKMYPTYVRDLPNGKERGKFVAIDLGPTRVRTTLVDLNGHKIDMLCENYPLPSDFLKVTGEMLFDYIASCLAQFYEHTDLIGIKLPIAFNFPFCCRSESLSNARLLQWSKGFQCRGVVGQNVVNLLRLSIGKLKLGVEKIILVNDSVGALLSCALKCSNCVVALVIGNGLNACYMEDLSRVSKWKGGRQGLQQVVINMEVGLFGSNNCVDFIRSKFDKDIDSESPNAGKYILQKMTAGYFLGEIVRKVVLHCIQEGIMLNGYATKAFKTALKFKTKYVASVNSDFKPKYFETRRVFEKMGVFYPELEDCECLELICLRVCDRAACLVAVTISTILNYLKRPHTSIGMAGFVYRTQARYRDLLERKVRDLTRPEYNFELVMADSGFGRGAAIAAAVDSRLEEEVKKEAEADAQSSS